MDTQATNSTEPPPSNTPPPSDSAPKSPPPPSSPPLNASSPPPPTEASPPPPTAASPPPPQASSPPPPSASSPPPPPPSANPPPSPSASSDNPPPPTQSPEKTPSPPSTYLPPTPPEQPANDSHPSSPAPKIGTPPRNSPPVPQSDVPPVPPSDVLSPPSPPPSPLSPPSSFGPPLVPPEPPVNVSGKSESSGGGIGTGGAVSIGLLFLGVIGVTVFWLCRRKKKFFAISPQSESALLRTRYSPANDSSCAGYDTASELSVMGRSTTWYSYDELARATNEFSESNLLGEGGFGSVYKGLLPDGREVAVKQLKDGGGQGEREFRAEVETISRVHHRHLVSLFGYCISNDKRLLVYNYLPKDSLHFHLHGQGEYVLDWPARSKIAIGAARGIAYLHEDCHPRIVHRDIKSSNILLDNNFEAQVSDFGLARLFSDANTHVTTRVVGTFGYMAPEYASSGKLTDKSDVFSFGVVLLELITGRKPIDASQPPGEESLVEWARPLLKYALDNEEFQKLVDPWLGKNYVEGEMFRMIEAAAACVRHSALKRPKMSQILRALDDLSVSDLSNGMRVGESAIIDSQHSAEMRMFRRMAFSSRDYSTDFFIQGDFRSDDQ